MRAERVGVDVDLDDGRVRRRSARRAAWSTCSARSPSRRSGRRRRSARRASGEAKPPETSERPRVAVRTAPWPRRRSPAARRSARRGAPARRGRRRRAHRGRRRRPAAAPRASASRQPRHVLGGRARRPARGDRRPRARAASATSARLHVQRQVQQHRAAFVHARSRTAAAASSTAVVGATSTRIGHRADRRGERVLVDVEVRRRLRSPRRRRTTSGVRLLAASVMPVIAFVSPQPWCTVTAADRAAHARVGVGHRRRAALVAGGDEAGAGRDHGVGDVEVAGADDAEDLVDAAPSTSARPTASRDRSRLVTARPAPAPAPGDPEPRDDGQRPRDQRRAPVGGQLRRGCCSWVRPYLPLPSRYEWHGKAGSKECAAPGVGADRLDAEADDRRLLGHPAGALGGEARACAGRSRRR